MSFLSSLFGKNTNNNTNESNDNNADYAKYNEAWADNRTNTGKRSNSGNASEYGDDTPNVYKVNRSYSYFDGK